MASVVALVSVRKADEPADAEHPYGHEKVENLAAAIEGMLILVGAGVIVYEATRRLVTGSEVEDLGVGIAVIGFSAVANFGVSALPPAPLARAALPRARRATPPISHRRADLGRRAGRPVPGRDHRRGRLRLDRRPLRRRGDRLLRPSHPHPLQPGARRRGSAGGGARPDRGGDRRPAQRRSRDRRLPQAPRPPRRGPHATSTSTSSFAPGPRSSARTRWRIASATRSRRRSRAPRC